MTGPNFDRGQALFDLKRYREAAEAFSQELVHNPDSPDAYAMRAAAWLHLNYISRAAADVADAMTLAPDSAFNHYLLSFVKAHQRTPIEAEAAIREAIRLDRQPCYFHRLAEIHSWMGRHEACLTATDHALAIDPSDRASLILKADVLNQLGRRSEAADLLRQALAVEAVDPEAHHALGKLTLRAGKPAEALGLLREARRLNPISHNDEDAIAGAYGRLLFPLRHMNAGVFSFQYWSSSNRWLLITAMCLTAIVVTAFDPPTFLVASVYLLVINAAIFATTLDLAAVAAGKFSYRRDLGLRRYHLFGEALRFISPFALHLILSVVAVSVVGLPAFAYFLLTLTPNLEVLSRSRLPSPSLESAQTGCLFSFVVVVPALLGALSFHLTQSLPAPLMCACFSWVVSYLVTVYL